jgi:hypothetical protein
MDHELFQYIGRAIELRVAVYQKYFSLDEIKRLNKNMDAKWADLEKATKKVLAQKLPAESEAAQKLVGQWSALIDEAANHEPAIREKLLSAIRSEPLIQAGAHLSVEVRDFIRCAYFAGQATTVLDERQ